MTLRMTIGSLLVAASLAGVAAQERTVMVGGEAMLPSRTIVANAVNSKDHTTLVAAVKAAGLVETLSGPGPFTVFAPTNAAFARLAAGTVESLVKPENKATLTRILTYHVVPERLDAETLMARIQAGRGTAELTTVSGGRLWATMNGPKNVVLKDEQGTAVEIATYDVFQSNGVIHVVTGVLMPS